MEAKELRIGNLVSFEDVFYRVFSIVHAEKEDYTIHLERKDSPYVAMSINHKGLKPIPSIKENLYIFDIEDINHLFDEIQWKLYSDITYDNNDSDKFKYIHLIQNIFLDLTGESLPFKKSHPTSAKVFRQL